MHHESAALSRSAQHPHVGSHGLSREYARQHVVVIRHHDVPLGFPPVRESEEIHDERGIHHLFGRPPVTVSQRIEKVDAMLPRQPTRSAREPGAELNTVVSSQECHPAVMIRSDSTGVRSLDLVDALKATCPCPTFVPSRVQPQAHPDRDPSADAYRWSDTMRSTCSSAVLAAASGRLVRNSAPDPMTAVCQSTKPMAKSKRRVAIFRRAVYNAPPPRPTATSTASGSGVKSSPGLMKRFRSMPYCLS